MPLWLRYLLFQMPGWLIAGTALWALQSWGVISAAAALLCLSVLLLKDLVLYPWLKTAYETSLPLGSKALIGARGIAASDVAPEGFIRVRGELWRGIAIPFDRAIPAGSVVEVVDADGMKIYVREWVPNP